MHVQTCEVRMPVNGGSAMVRTLLFACTTICLTVEGCGSGAWPSLSSDAGVSVEARAYVTGPVSRGIVTAYAVNGDGSRGNVVASAATDANGSFHLTALVTGVRPVLVVLSSGSFVEPSTGTSIVVDGAEILALLPSAVRIKGNDIAATLSPEAHMVAQLALYMVSKTTDVDTAIGTASRLIASHFAG